MFKYFLTFLLLLQTHYLIAQDSGTPKPYLFPQDITISADRFETPLRFSASSVTIITEEEIKNSGTTNALELLKSVSGLEFFQYGGKGQSASVMLRGHDAGHTLVLIDGVEQNMASDPSNIADFGNINLDNIKRIEVIRGTQSSAYGSNAMGGIISIITKSANENPSIHLNSEYGSHFFSKSQASAAKSFGTFGVVVSGLSESAKGYSSSAEKYGNFEKDGSRNSNFSSKLTYDPLRDFHLELNSKFSKSKTDLDQYGAWGGDDSTYVYNFEEFASRFSGNYNLPGNIFNLKFGASYIRNVRNYKYDITKNNDANSTSQYDGRRLKTDLQLDFFINEFTSFSAGMDNELQRAASIYTYNSPYWSSISQFPDTSLSTTGIFASLRYQYQDFFYISLGGRADKHKTLGTINTYRIAPVLRNDATDTKLKFLFSNGFRAPSLFNLLDPAYGNKYLKPEKNTSFEVGIEQGIKPFNSMIEVTYFKSSLTDLFGSDPMTFKSLNINNAQINGIESQFTFNYEKLFRFNANYTYLLAVDKGSVAADYDKSLLRRPKRKASASISISAAENLFANFEVLYVGKRDDKFFDMRDYSSGRLVLSPYTLMNIAITYKFDNKLELYTRVNNIANVKYEEIFGFGTPGFTLNFGVRLDFDL